MARNDYFVIACRILSYLYACLKEGEKVDADFISSEWLGVPESYRDYVLRHLFTDGYIEGVQLVTIVGHAEKKPKIQPDFSITPKGIEFLQENPTMDKARDFLKSLKEIVPGI